MIDRKCFAFNALKYIEISHLSVSKVELLEGSTEGKHLVITCTLMVDNQEIYTHAPIDC